MLRALAGQVGHARLKPGPFFLESCSEQWGLAGGQFLRETSGFYKHSHPAGFIGAVVGAMGWPLVQRLLARKSIWASRSFESFPARRSNGNSVPPPSSIGGLKH
jgi:hypothetical protein